MTYEIIEEQKCQYLIWRPVVAVASDNLKSLKIVEWYSMMTSTFLTVICKTGSREGKMAKEIN